MKKYRILVTGGPTRAYLDDVRFLSNVSTGEVAFRICKALVQKGHQVSAIIGPSSFPFAKLGLKHFRSVETTGEMQTEVLKICRSFKPHLTVFSAAVLDFEPVRAVSGKVASSKGWTVRLRPTPKIIQTVAKKFPKIRRVAFKLEPKSGRSSQAVSFGRKTLERYGADALVLNYLDEIRGTSHVARVFRPGMAPQRVGSKEGLARFLVSSGFLDSVCG